jgi:DNA-binding transcriptional ArsR family regulator
VGTSQSNISQHLAILRDKEVLLTRKDANRVYYRVGDHTYAAAYRHDARGLLQRRRLTPFSDPEFV